jgi:ceramide glucosyltransferase
MNFPLIALIAWLCGCVFTTLGAFFLSIHFCFTRKTVPSPLLPGISVLKPLKGIDADSRANLESFFRIQYPRFELIFCVACSTDPAVALVEELLRENPLVSARLFFGEMPAGANPKICNMLGGYYAAQFETIVISDSNIRVKPSYLTQLYAEFVGHDLVSSVVMGKGSRNFVGRMEELFLGGFYARPMVLTQYIRRPCVMGKSMMFIRSKMEGVGDLKSLAPYLAEDYMAGEKFLAAGYGVAVSHVPVMQQVGAPTLKAFWSRHLRWGRIRKTYAKPIFMIEPLLTNAVLSGLLGAFALSHFTKLSFFAALLIHLTVWCALDLFSLFVGGCKIRISLVPAWLAREILHLPLWVHIGLGSQIQWKGAKWRLSADGRLLSPSVPLTHVGQAEKSDAASA